MTDPSLHEKMMRLALDQAHLAFVAGEVPVGAVVAREDRVLAQAHNRTQGDQDPTAHAEVLALRLAAAQTGDFRLSDCVLYVTLEPCAMCAGAIGAARLQGLWYGAQDARAGCCGSVYHLAEDASLGFSVHTFPGLLSAECAALLRRFFAEKRGTPGAF